MVAPRLTDSQIHTCAKYLKEYVNINNVDTSLFSRTGKNAQRDDIYTELKSMINVIDIDPRDLKLIKINAGVMHKKSDDTTSIDTDDFDHPPQKRQKISKKNDDIDLSTHSYDDVKEKWLVSPYPFFITLLPFFTTHNPFFTTHNPFTFLSFLYTILPFLHNPFYLSFISLYLQQTSHGSNKIY